MTQSTASAAVTSVITTNSSPRCRLSHAEVALQRRARDDQKERRFRKPRHGQVAFDAAAHAFSIWV
jgi:hypothetical protein